MELGDPYSGERGERSQLDAVLDKLNDDFAELLDTLEAGGLDHLGAAEKISFWRRFEIFRNRLPLVDHGLIADAEASDVAGEYSYSNLARFLVRDVPAVAFGGQRSDAGCCRCRSADFDAGGAVGAGVAEAGCVATRRCGHRGEGADLWSVPCTSCPVPV